MITRVPFLPLNVKTAKRIMNPLAGVSRRLTFLRPALSSELVQIDAGLEPEEYMGVFLLSVAYAFTAAVFLLYLLGVLFKTGLGPTGLGLAFLFSGIVGWQVLYYPNLLLRKKINKINRDLLFALRHMLVQVRSGVSLYTSFVSVSEADYGIISQEFSITAAEINAGISQTVALERMAMRNPSTYLRRAIWQLTNALKTGSDIGETLSMLVQEFTAEEMTKLRRFGRELSPWALMYLMLTVVFPTMGVALFLIIGAFAAIQVSNFTLMIALAMFITFQVFFIKFIKNKRPVVNF